MHSTIFSAPEPGAHGGSEPVSLWQVDLMADQPVRLTAQRMPNSRWVPVRASASAEAPSYYSEDSNFATPCKAYPQQMSPLTTSSTLAPPTVSQRSTVSDATESSRITTECNLSPDNAQHVHVATPPILSGNSPASPKCAWQGGASLIPATSVNPKDLATSWVPGQCESEDLTSQPARINRLVADLASELQLLGQKRCAKRFLDEQAICDEANLEHLVETLNLEISSCHFKCMLMESATRNYETAQVAKEDCNNSMRATQRRCKELWQPQCAMRDNLEAITRRRLTQSGAEIRRLREQKQRYTEEVQALLPDGLEGKQCQRLAAQELCRFLTAGTATPAATTTCSPETKAKKKQWS